MSVMVSMVICGSVDQLTLQTRHSVDIQAVRSVANFVAVLKVAPPHVEMNIAFPCVVASIEIGELGKERAGVLGIRMEINVVDEVDHKVYKENNSKIG